MSDEETDFYQILGIDKSASDDEIKRAFRKFSKKYHPDMQHDKSDAEKKEAEEMFKKGQAAYECLSDPEKRKVYDEYGIDGLRGHAQESGFSGGMPDGLRDFLRNHMRGFGFGFNPFGDDEEDDDGFNPFGHSRSSKKKTPSTSDPEDGPSYRIRMQVDLEDVIFGREKEISIDGFNVCPECHGHKCESYEECPDCKGTGTHTRIQGNVIFQSSCPTCNGEGFKAKGVCNKCMGSGRTKIKRQIKVRIPIGMPEGGQMRVRGAGCVGLNGGTDGDLFIVLTTKEHPIFRRENRSDLDLEVDLFVNPLISLCGGNVSIPTPYEMKARYLSAGTKTGQKILIPDYGIRKSSAEKGDLIVNVYFDSISQNNLTQNERAILTTAFDTIEKNRNCLVNSKKQTKDLNEKTKLPWILSV